MIDEYKNKELCETITHLKRRKTTYDSKKKKMYEIAIHCVEQFKGEHWVKSDDGLHALCPKCGKVVAERGRMYHVVYGNGEKLYEWNVPNYCSDCGNYLLKRK